MAAVLAEPSAVLGLPSVWGAPSIGAVGSSSSLPGLQIMISTLCIEPTAICLRSPVNRDLNSNLATLDLLAVHVRAGLLLHLLTTESHEAEATALAGLVASLELANHELGDRAEGDLGGGGGVVGEKLKELKIGLAGIKIRYNDEDGLPSPRAGRRGGWRP